MPSNRAQRRALVTVLAALLPSAGVRADCKPGDPVGFFEGTAVSGEPGKLDVTLNLRCHHQGLRYLVDPIRDHSALNRKGHLFVLIGVNTFSAAMSNATQFRAHTEAILVGEPIGETPNSYPEAREMHLPNSQLVVRYSTKYDQFLESGENIVRPDQEVITSWDDHRAGRDPVLDWALSYGRSRPAGRPSN